MAVAAYGSILYAATHVVQWLMTPEGEVVRDIKKLLAAEGYWVLKFRIISVRGFPDLICLGHGRVFFIEVKRPGAKPGPLQLKRQKQLKARGIVAAWVDNVEDVEKILEAYTHP